MGDAFEVVPKLTQAVKALGGRLRARAGGWNSDRARPRQRAEVAAMEVAHDRSRIRRQLARAGARRRRIVLSAACARRLARSRVAGLDEHRGLRRGDAVDHTHGSQVASRAGRSPGLGEHGQVGLTVPAPQRRAAACWRRRPGPCPAGCSPPKPGMSGTWKTSKPASSVLSPRLQAADARNPRARVDAGAVPSGRRAAPR
jgi:hypothetical protein